MKTKSLIIVILFLVLAFWSCENASELEEEYVINSGVPDVSAGTNWFNVVNVNTDVSKGVSAVVQLDGFVYMPLHSHMPAFADKVVSGVFVADTNYFNDMDGTVFRVTEYLRDIELTE